VFQRANAPASPRHIDPLTASADDPRQARWKWLLDGLRYRLEDRQMGHNNVMTSGERILILISGPS
jgi:hypothetical protein